MTCSPGDCAQRSERVAVRTVPQIVVPPPQEPRTPVVVTQGRNVTAPIGVRKDPWYIAPRGGTTSYIDKDLYRGCMRAGGYSRNDPNGWRGFRD